MTQSESRSFASTALDGSSGSGSLQLGPYRVTAELTRAPGAWLVEGRLATGESVLLQLAHVRAARVPEEDAEQADYVKMIASATEHFRSDPEAAGILHGAESYADGSLILYWVLPFPEGAHRLGQVKAMIPTAEDLVKVALSLLTRLKTRHERGRLEPLLSEQLMLTLPDGAATLAGIPIHLPPEWLAEDMTPARLAPEEKATAEPRRTGDLWRLGQALKAIAADLELLPPDLRHVLDRLIDPDATRRISSANEALEEFKTLLRQSTAWTQAVDTSLLGPPPPMPPLQGFLQVARDLAAPMSESPFVPERRSILASEPDLTMPPLEAPPLPPLAPKTPLPVDDAPTWEPRELATQRVSLAESRAASLAKGAPVRPADSSTDPDSADAMQTIRPYGRTPIAPVAPEPSAALLQQTITGDKIREGEGQIQQTIVPPGPEADAASESTLRDVPPETLLEPGESPTIDDATLKRGQQPKANLWDRAIIPAGVVETVVPPGPSPLPPREPEPFAQPDPKGRTPRPELRRTGDHAAPPIRRSGDYAAPPVRRAFEPPVPASRVPPQKAGPSMGKNIALGAIGFFVAGGLVALALLYVFPRSEVVQRFDPQPVEPPPPVVDKAPAVTIAPHGDVILKSDPEDATVVSEEDGRVLGETPLRFMVPPGGAPILVTAPGHEPQRLVLPDRGRVTAELLELQDKRPCELKVTPPAGQRLEAVAATIEDKAGYRVPGSVILRATDGTGAWIVRCPSYGGTDAQVLPARAGKEPHSIEIYGPSDGIVAIDGAILGKVPQQTKVTAKFVSVRVELEAGVAIERWVPVSTDLKIGLPRPRKKKADDDPGAKDGASERDKKKRGRRPIAND